VRLLERERELAAIEQLLASEGRVLVVEGGAGIGKTSLLEAARASAETQGYEVLTARGSELEAGYAFGLVRQLFDRRLATAVASEREALLAGPAGAARTLFADADADALAEDATFAVLHGLYWLAANLASVRPLAIAVDDAHWADPHSLRWLAYLAARLQGLPLVLLVALRPAEPASQDVWLLAVRHEAAQVLRPSLLSQTAVSEIVRDLCGGDAEDEFCTAVYGASGGNPFYLQELMRALERAGQPTAEGNVSTLLGGGEVAQHVLARVRRLDPQALALAQALAVLGDGCELHHAAVIARIDARRAAQLAAALVRLEVLAADEPPRFLHPVVLDVVAGSLGTDERDEAHRAAGRVLETSGAPPGEIAAHLIRIRPAGDAWVLARLRDAARAALESGAPQAAAELLGRALAEPPQLEERVTLLREVARAEAQAGNEAACGHLEEALRLAADTRERAEIALEAAEVYASLFRWVEAVDGIERALAELGQADPLLTQRLEGELVVSGLHDARRAAQVPPVLERIVPGTLDAVPGEAFAVAQGMAALLGGGQAADVAVALELVLARADPEPENWDTRAALLWTLITAERFETVEEALKPMRTAAHRSGSARGFVAVYSTLGLLKLRLGSLPDADAAARVALEVVEQSDLGAGLPFAATVLADVAVESGGLEEAQALLELLPSGGWPAGVGTVLIPAARGRLRLAQGRPADALADFRCSGSMFGAEAWGVEMRDNGYLHWRSGAARALLLLGEHEQALRMAEAELADVRVFGGLRALGIALRVAGLARGGQAGLELLRESVSVLGRSPALLERGHSLAELGAALRRSGQRAAARGPLADALDLAARCGARPLAARARDELKATGARPRREWRAGVEALSPSELRVARLAAQGHSNRQIAHELYVTMKTVEGHLARAYDKLGIASRANLPEALEGEKTRVVTP
jgi:DNA-binding CsgD family transcriptional regulator